MGFKDYQAAMSGPIKRKPIRPYNLSSVIGALITGDTKLGRPDVNLDEFASSLPKEIASVWDTLTPAQKRAVINDSEWYKEDNDYTNFWGLVGDKYTFDSQALLDELSSISQMQADYAAVGDAPVYQDYLDAARDAANAQVTELMKPADELLAQAKTRYETDLANISNDYTNLRRNLVTQQYQNNAQLMDTLSSNLDRNRRNALEAGASAGIRIAENINTLLSVQNKQSAAAMNTANQLSQMMIDQRAQERGAYDTYSKAQSDHMNRKQELTLGAEDRAVNTASTNYNAAQNSYDRKLSDVDSKYAGTNLYDYRGMFKSNNTSKYGS